MKTIKLKDLSSRMEAEVIKSFLSSQGILSVVTADDHGGMRPSMQMSSGVSIWVDQNDFSRAQGLLNERSENE